MHAPSDSSLIPKRRKLPRYKHVHLQLSLPFAAMVKSMTYWTGTIGELFEEASAALTKGRRLIADSQSQYSPDVEVIPSASYIESKACGKSGRVIMYSRRAEREAKWAEVNDYALTYHIWHHNFVTKDYLNEEELLIDATNCVRGLYIIPASLLYTIARENPTKVVNRWNPVGYTDGWLIPIKKIQLACPHITKKLKLTVNATLPVKLKNLTIYSTDPIDRHAKLQTATTKPVDPSHLRPDSRRPF